MIVVLSLWLAVAVIYASIVGIRNGEYGLILFMWTILLGGAWEIVRAVKRGS